MRKLLFITFFIVSFLSLRAQDSEFRLYSCETTSLVTLKNGKLYFLNDLLERVEYETNISEDDLVVLNNEIKDIMTKKGNEVWLNHCIDDGTNLKFKIIKNKILIKKVFVGNYVDRRLNKIILIIDKYLKEISTSSFITTISYGFKDEDYVKSKIDYQKKCPMIAPRKYKKAMLNNWCEF